MNCTMDKVCEMNEMELEKVNGGFNLIGARYAKAEDVVFKFEVGSHVEIVTAYLWRAFTKGCTVIDRKVDRSIDGRYFCAWYKVRCSDELYDNDWYEEDVFEGGFYGHD